MSARIRALVAVVALAALAACSSAPGKSIHAQDVMLYAPAAITSGEATLQVCVIPARRYAALEDAPARKTMLVVPLTRVDRAPGEPTFAGALGYPVTFAVRPPWFLTLRDGFLKVDADRKTRVVSATVEGAKGPVAPPLADEGELWVWIGDEPTRDEPAPRGTFVGVRLAK